MGLSHSFWHLLKTSISISFLQTFAGKPLPRTDLDGGKTIWKTFGDSQPKTFFQFFFLKNFPRRKKLIFLKFNFDRINFGRINFGKINFGRINIGRINFGRINFAQKKFAGKINFFVPVELISGRLRNQFLDAGGN